MHTILIIVSTIIYNEYHHIILYITKSTLKGGIILNNKKLMGIGVFQLQILHLISIGANESFESIEKNIDENTLIEYIYNKYQDEFSIPFDNSLYDNETLNQYFHDYTGYIQGNESRKYGIMNESDGLLLVLALISDKIEKAAANWTN